MKHALLLCVVAGCAGVVSANPADVNPAGPTPFLGATPNVGTYGSLTDVVLYDNGPLVTNPGAGAGGADASAISPGGSTFGFGAQIGANNRVADDFVIPGGQQWKVDSITFFTYQTGSTTTSTITSADMKLWSGAAPGGTSAGSSTSILSNAFTNIFRVTSTTLTTNNRPIMAVEMDFGGLILNAGQFWIDWQAAGSLASGPWAPPVSSASAFITGNAQQSIAGGAFAAMIDAGASLQVALPFIVKGSIVPAPSALALLGLGGLVAGRRRR